MECPQCGYVRLKSEPECPRCIEIAALLKTRKLKSPELTPVNVSSAAPALRLCHACGQILDSDARFCKICGAAHQASLANSAEATGDGSPPQAAAGATEAKSSSLHVTLISVMWTLTAVQMVLLWVVRLKPPAPFWIYAPAFVIAILLAASPQNANKGHGWANLTLEGVVLAVVTTMTMLQYQR